MSKSTIILITGFPGTGKTTLGKVLSERFKLPFFTKDAFKERMFDTLGWRDKAWSSKVSAASHRIMDYIIEEELKAGRSIILESNFRRTIDSERFKKFQARHDCAVLQILCWAEGEVLYKRFMDRQGTAARHPGHVEVPPEMVRAELIKGKDTPIDINGETIELDTTNLDTINYTPILDHISSLTA